MSLGLRARRFRSLVCSVAAILFTVGTMSVGAEGRPQVTATEYDGVACIEVARVYKAAYVAAGFYLNQQATRHEEGAGGRTFTRLQFSFQNPKHANRKAGLVSFVLMSAESNPETASCSVSREIFGIDSAAYSEEEWNQFHSRMLTADRKAVACVQDKLGKSVPPAG